MNRKKQIAVIGCGTIANAQHIPAYLKNEGCEIKYFCDIIPERADEMVKKYGCGKAVYDHKEILNDPELDAVSVCTPNRAHSEIAIHFLRAGKDVLCEKPAARTYEQALEMQRVQHETGRILNIGVVNRFNTAVNHIKDLIDNGELGEVYHVYVSFRAPRSIPGLGGAFTNSAIAGGGALIDWGVHFLDIVMYCCGDPEPLTASGKAFCKLGKDMKNYTYTDMWAGPPDYDGIYDVDDSVTGFIRTAGPTLTINGAWAQNVFEDEMYIDFLGDQAGIRLQYGGDFKLYTAKNGMLEEIRPKFRSEPMFEMEINSFLEDLDSREKLPSHIDNAVLTSKIMQAIYDSSDSGREVDITAYPVCE